MPHRISPKAIDDLASIYGDGAEGFGIPQAERYLAGLTRAFEFLAVHPHAMRLRYELSPPIRAFRFKSHMIFYDLGEDDVITIRRVRHGREDWSSGPL